MWEQETVMIKIFLFADEEMHSTLEVKRFSGKIIFLHSGYEQTFHQYQTIHRKHNGVGVFAEEPFGIVRGYYR